MLAPIKVEGHPEMWESRFAMADPDNAEPHELDGKLYWVEKDGMSQYIDATVHLGMSVMARDLVAKARQLVELMDDAERNHGSLIGGKTLTAVNELRLELSRWQK